MLSSLIAEKLKYIIEYIFQIILKRATDWWSFPVAIIRHPDLMSSLRGAVDIYWRLAPSKHRDQCSLLLNDTYLSVRNIGLKLVYQTGVRNKKQKSAYCSNFPPNITVHLQLKRIQLSFFLRYFVNKIFKDKAGCIESRYLLFISITTIRFNHD